MPVVISVSGVQYSGSWSLSSQANAKALGTWPIVGQRLFTWGYNGNGGLGLGNTTWYSSPKQVGSLNIWSTVVAETGSAGTSLATRTDGTLWGWGNNGTGQLGLGNTTNYSSPKQIGVLTTWSAVYGDASFVFGITTSGALWAWGQNDQGQLGLGNLTNYSSPKQVGSLTNWSKLACASDHILAIKTDGTLWSWGYNNFGQLGRGNTTATSSPVQIGALTNWLSIAANYASSYAVKSDGTIWSWGYNVYGQLGLGNTTDYSSPMQIGALTTWLSAACTSDKGTLAIKTGGTLWAWGGNANGTLGLGNTTRYSSPKQVGSLTDWASIAGQDQSSWVAGIKTDGTLWSWGVGSQGQLGLGNITKYSSPKQVGSQTGWRRIIPGGFNAMALQD